MPVTDWIAQLALGGLLGMLGQGVRVIGGLKKVHDQAAQQSKEFGDLFELSTLVISLLIGFIAGALAILALGSTQGLPDPANVDRKTIMALLAAGYAGTDFIEAFMKKYLPDQSNGKTADAKAAADGGAPADVAAPPAVG
jgi:putative chitinase